MMPPVGASREAGEAGIPAPRVRPGPRKAIMEGGCASTGAAPGRGIRRSSCGGQANPEIFHMNAPLERSLREVSLDDKYDATEGLVYLTGTQALVRLPLMQRQRDLAAGLNTAGYTTGYRGSPLGGYDQALTRARKHLAAHHVKFVPGVNEDLAATAIWGTQQANLFPGGKYDGVFGIWYGKGPGVDRSGDALRHANQAGTAPHGGVLAIAGDDHAAKSSTMAA